MTDLDQLLRDTLHARAATITEAPHLETTPRRADRSRWLLVAASVATVLVAAGGVAVWGLGRSNGQDHAGGGYAQSCPAMLPKAWSDAFAAPRSTVPGFSASVVAATAYGDVVVWGDVQTDTTTGIGLRPVGGTVRTLYTVPAGWTVQTSVDGADLVLSLGPVARGPNVKDIVAINLRTSTVRHLLPLTGTLSDTAVADRAASVLDGIVYWIAIPHGTDPGQSVGAVVAYDLRRHRATVVAHAHGLLAQPDDPGGVMWDGGGVARRGVPAAVPSTRSDDYHSISRTYGSVVTDGIDYAWIPIDRQNQVVWTDTRGDARSWTLAAGSVPGKPDVVAVSGPFVVLLPDEHEAPRYYVLDTRTGALAATGVDATGAGVTLGTRMVLGTQAASQAPTTSIVLDTAHLPRLTC
ncbi:hypothetical protein [uncultured Jatrophihabitans sp.]|uniref:hypothetical protein n=1 Tax=uncultured Jatrophihabitans sp. TaxID=1610747 RepID=UPI0035CBC330